MEPCAVPFFNARREYIWNLPVRLLVVARAVAVNVIKSTTAKLIRRIGVDAWQCER